MGILEMNAAMTIANQCNSKNNEKLDTLEKDKFLHEIAIEANVFFNSIKKEEKIISKMLNSIIKIKNLNLDEKCPGYFNAEDVFILCLYCEDFQNLKDNLDLIMKFIFKEQRTFEYLVDILNNIYEKNINNCKTFLTEQIISDILNYCNEFVEEKENI